jgi:hypothetical protein
MNKIAITLFAVAALSTASFAGVNTGSELRDTNSDYGQIMSKAVDTSAIMVMERDKASTSFENLKWISEQNDQGGRH